ncbi:hypothetical protein [uncultured Fenollaria sp.]|uniref:hypothetical protein n=1 Tax=uncultured Fenollaria sp. TaxID=1686315 RepID=UPI0025E64347|nr:hypothetical protein [uncultured Fenollaria sp.]
MKKKISLLLAILMLVTLIPTAFAESKTVDAVKNTKKVTLDGEEVMVGAYDVEGYNYLKLRDVAAILNGKKCQFDVGYDKPTKLISIELAKAYEKVEGDLAEIKDEKAKAIIRVIKILVNGEEKEVKTALINENNYMQLRDLGSLVGLDVKYDAANKVIMLKSDAEEKEEAPRYVMIKSKLYKDTGEINKNMTCGTMDGKILTTVDAKEMPKKDNESNFGIGYEYQIGGEDGSITVEIDDKCLIFKEVKEEEKTEDKKDEKKEEKKEEASEKNIKVLKTDNFDELETTKLDAIIKLHDMFAAYTKDDYIVGGNAILDAIPFSEYMITLKNMAKLVGTDIYLEDRTVSKRIEEIDGKKYYVAEIKYANGSSIIQKLPFEQDGDNVTMATTAGIMALIAKDYEKDSILKKGSEFITTKVKAFHDALCDKNYKAAAEALNDLNFKADEENVKKTAELRLKNAKELGEEVFAKDYDFTFKEYETGVVCKFKYKNGASFEVYIGDQFSGLGTFVLPKEQ